MSFSQQSLERALSVERLQPYLVDARGDIDLAWRLYRWNLDLAGAIVPLVADVEVTLRNTLHDKMTALLGRADWWGSPKLLLDDNTRQMIAPVVVKHRKKLDKGTEGPGRVIADLTFGVWVNLLGRGSKTEMQQSVDYEANLWRKTLMYGFQIHGETNARGQPKRPIRRHVHDPAANLQALRNAAMHHRRISGGIRRPGAPGSDQRIPLSQVLEASIELLGWMSPELAHHHREALASNSQLLQRPR